MELPTTFARRLHLARQNARWNQDELGAKVGLSGDTIGRLERGQTTWIAIEVFRRLARALDVTTDWLLAMDVHDEEEESSETELASPRL